MVENVTLQIVPHLTQEVVGFLAILNGQNEFLRRATASAAIGEISEELVSILTGAERLPHHNPGADLQQADGQRIEVKSRFVDGWGGGLQFNFRRQVAHNAQIAYCFVWERNADGITIQSVYRLKVTELCERWGIRGNRNYCARTTLGQLSAAI